MRKNKKSRSLSITLSIYFLSLILTSLLILGAIGQVFNFQAQQEIVFSRQQLIAQNAANKVTGFIQEKFSALETTAALINPYFTPPQEQDRILNHLVGPHPAFRQLVLLNANRQKLVVISRLSSKGSGEFEKLMVDALFMQTRLGNNYISSVYMDKITSEPMIIIAVPIKNVFNEFLGVVLAEVNLKFMWDLVEGLKIGESGLAYVVERQGKLIAFGDISRVLKGENVKDLQVVQEFMNNFLPTYTAAVKIFTGINGTMAIGSYVSLGVPDWAVVTELPLAEAYRSVTQAIVYSLIFMLIMAAVAGWIGVYLARHLSIPIVKLMETATRIAGGEMELQADTGGPAEISGLARAFNSMTTQLREVIANLEERGRYLQTTVQKYAEYMVEVGKGKFDLSLMLEEPEGESNDPLVILGWQLNHTTESIKEMIGQIRESADRLERHELKLQIYSDKLERSNQELDQFAAIASHDLQAPLRKIKFFGDKLKANLRGNLDEKVVDYLEMMNNSIVQMENFIRDLLHYSRVTAKSKPIEKVDLNEIVKEILSDLEININETGAEIKTERLPVLDADALQMRQLFLNIIGNALKYHRADVSPLISINSTIKHNGEEDFCEIYIADNGIGFDNKYAEQIFGIFQRLHGKDEYPGTGIGLAICKKIVVEHGGEINAFARKEEGATFYIKLPLISKVAS